MKNGILLFKSCHISRIMPISGRSQNLMKSLFVPIALGSSLYHFGIDE